MRLVHFCSLLLTLDLLSWGKISGLSLPWRILSSHKKGYISSGLSDLLLALYLLLHSSLNQLTFSLRLSTYVWYLIIWTCPKQIWGGINQPSLSKWLLTLQCINARLKQLWSFFYASHHFFLFWTIKFLACLFHRCFLNIFIISCAEDNSVLIHYILM